MLSALVGLTRWGLDTRQVRDRMYRAPPPRERERWHALWLLAQGWSASTVAERLERDAHTVGAAAQAGLKVAVQAAVSATMTIRSDRSLGHTRSGGPPIRVMETTENRERDDFSSGAH